MVLLCRSPEAAFSFSVLSDFGSVSPVAAHPLSEIAVVVVVVVQAEGRQEPEGHGGSVKGSLFLPQVSKRPAGDEDGDPARLSPTDSSKSKFKLVPLKPFTPVAVVVFLDNPKISESLFCLRL